MGIGLDDAERAALLATTHTGVLTTLRADGRPVSLPVWFAVIDGDIYVETPAAAAKVRRSRRDPRGTFLVERGTRWQELTALHLDVEITVVDDPAEIGPARAAIAARYADLHPAPESLPRAVRAAYDDQIVLRLHPTGPSLSWANTKIRM